MALDNREAVTNNAAFNQKIASFKPDAIMTLVETSHTTRFTNGIATSIVGATYLASFIDLPTKRTVWKAQVTLNTGTGLSGRDPGAELASDIVNRMAQDGLLRSCGPAAK